MFKIAAVATALFALVTSVAANPSLQTVTDSTILRSDAEAKLCTSMTIKNPGQFLITNPDYYYQYIHSGKIINPHDYVVIDVREAAYYKEGHLDDAKAFPVQINSKDAITEMQAKFNVASIDLLPPVFRRHADKHHRYVIITGSANSVVGAEVALAYWQFVKSQGAILEHQSVVLMLGGYEAAYNWNRNELFAKKLDFDGSLFLHTH